MIDLSICVTNWNKSDLLSLQFRLIGLAIDECNRHMERRGEPHKRFEVIVVDHGSNDNHQALFWDTVFDSDFKNKLNLSAYRMDNLTLNHGLALNIIIKRAKGKFTMWLPSDCMPLVGLQRFLDHHVDREIFLKSQIISFPSDAYRNFSAQCWSNVGSTCKTKYWHEIKGCDERKHGAYTGEDKTIVGRIIRDTAVTEKICGKNLFTMHFDREVHPEAVHNVDLQLAHETRKKYANQEWETPVNPDGWGECTTLEKIL